MKRKARRAGFIGFLILFAVLAGLAAAGGGNSSPAQQPIQFTCGQGQVWNGSGCLYP